eukprot:scaffold2785_cov66-Skeletonema_marinoi.AAC.1
MSWSPHSSRFYSLNRSIESESRACPESSGFSARQFNLPLWEMTCFSLIPQPQTPRYALHWARPRLAQGRENKAACILLLMIVPTDRDLKELSIGGHIVVRPKLDTDAEIYSGCRLNFGSIGAAF